MYDNDEAEKALIEAGAWFIYAKWRAREIECAVEMIRDEAVRFTKNTERLRFMEFGEMLQQMTVVSEVYPALLVAHNEGMNVLDRHNIEGGNLAKIYKRAKELGVPADAVDLFR